MEYKTLRVPKNTYDEVKTLQHEIERKKIIPAVNKVNMNMALNYALAKAMESLSDKERRARFISVAGSWANLDANGVLKGIYKDRKKSIKPIVRW